MQSIQKMLQHKPRSYLPLVAKTALFFPFYKLDRLELDSSSVRAKNSPAPSWIAKQMSEVYRQKASYWLSNSYLCDGAKFLIKAENVLSFESIKGTSECTKEFLEKEIALRTTVASELESWRQELTPLQLPGQAAQKKMHAAISRVSEYAGEMRLQAGDRHLLLNSFGKAGEDYLKAIADFDKALNTTTAHLGNSNGALERLSQRKTAAEEKLLHASENFGYYNKNCASMFMGLENRAEAAKHCEAAQKWCGIALGLASKFSKQELVKRLNNDLLDARKILERISIAREASVSNLDNGLC